MVDILRTDSTHPDFIALVGKLDAYLAIINGDEHAFYNQFNKISHLNHVVIAYENGVPLGCGAIKEFEPGAVEVKRMFIVPESRGKGMATRVLSELEKWAAELGYIRCVLETGKSMPDAVSLYRKNGYERVENYGQYVGVENSVCFGKVL